MDDRSQSTFVTYTLILCTLATAIVLGVFIMFFHDRSIGGPSDFADFASYFGNMILPLLTAGSLIFLAVTLRQQTHSFKLQKNTEIRKEIEDSLKYHYEQYEKLIHKVAIPNPEHSHTIDFEYSISDLISRNDFHQHNILGNAAFDPNNVISQLIVKLQAPEEFSLPVLSLIQAIKSEQSSIIITTAELVKHLNSTWVLESYIRRAADITENLKDINLISEIDAESSEEILAVARTEGLSDTLAKL
ncbi:hypothetical protein C9940_00515 [Pseudidiomarina aestuarii]|uniref:Uncharacterized protein n=1 Tax=Pseudidiomarina aestuarii TaxID=624146 RepID=A0A2T4CZ79_9GAMM|nr:hypothetical protein C9940_00515 [Pseudidiomarina aestuarii]